MGSGGFERFKELVERPFRVHQFQDVPHFDFVSGRKVRGALFETLQRGKRVLLDEKERDVCSLGGLEELRSRAPAAS